MNFQDSLKKAITEAETGKIIKDQAPDPRLVEYASKTNQKQENQFDFLRSKFLIKKHLDFLTQRSSGIDFKINDHNAVVLNLIHYWFLQDIGFVPTAAQSGIVTNRPSLNKGILIVGGFGTGKTTIIEAYQSLQWPGKQFHSKPCPLIAETWNDNSLNHYRKGNWYFDEFGHEGQATYSKKDAMPVMTRLLEQRYYDLKFSKGKPFFTIITTNLTLDEITAKYGQRLADRIKDMFNIIILLGESHRD